MSRPFSTCRLLALAAVAVTVTARAAAAQDVPNREAAIEVRARFMNDLDSLQSKFTALADAIPAEKYSWRPGAGVRSIGEVFMHVASEFYFFAPISYGAASSPVIPREKGAFEKFEANSTKADVMKHLQESFAYTKQALSGLDPAAITGTHKLFGGNRTIIETSLLMSDDLHEHLGQLIAYARMNNIKPPWTK
jgi:hypothetical protein